MSVYHKERPAFLCAALESIFSQTVLPSEVILVEDGPLTENLYKVVKDYENKYSTLRVVPLKKNMGLGAALNIGLEKSSNELVARMDSDDVCKPNRFEEQLKVFESNPSIDVCSAWIDEFEKDPTEVISQRKVPEHHDLIYAYAKKRCPVNHVCVMYKRSKVLKLGGYQGFPEDYFLWVRMLMSGCKFYNIQQSLVWVRFDSSVLKRRGGLKYAKQDFIVQKKFYKMGFINFPQFVYTVLIRGIVRIVPNNIRVIVYKTFLRQ